MEMFELKKMGLNPINEAELCQVNGGMLGLLTLPITGFLTGYLYEKISRAFD
jgi:hypothetical protein